MSGTLRPLGAFAMLAADERQDAARRPRITADVDSSPLTRTLGRNVLTVDGPDHARMRSGMDAPMRPRAVEG